MVASRLWPMPRVKRVWSFKSMATATKRKLDAGSYLLTDQVVASHRVTKVVKGGKNMSFAALVVVGDPSAGVVGYGSGKAKEVAQAIRKGIESAKKNLVKVNLSKTSIQFPCG